MTRNILPLLATLVITSYGAPALSSEPPQIQGQPQQQKPQAQPSQALAGTWSATVNWNLPSGLMIITTFMPNGRIQSTTQNHQGMSFTLAGTYEFNAAQGTLSYKWQDFSPKQTCVGGYCTPAQPPAPMGVVTTNKIRFLSANQLVATSNEASTTYVRTNATGFPTH